MCLIAGGTLCVRSSPVPTRMKEGVGKGSDRWLKRLSSVDEEEASWPGVELSVGVEIAK